MEEKRTYEFGIHFMYENINNPKFRPKEKSIFHSIRTREFMASGFWTDIAPTIHARDYKDPKCVIVPVKHKTVERRIVAMRGRNPNNPSERARSNGNYQQRFEFNSQGICNTLTTVDKDNYLLEITYG